MVAPTTLPDGGRSLRIFSPTLRLAWATLSVLTILSEIAPRSPSLPPVAYYSYTACKAALFVLLGFLSPLTFWRFDSLGLGLLLSLLVAGAVEVMQSISIGHRASYVELAAKFALLLVGFAYALTARYDGVLRLGPLRFALLDSHRSNKL